MKKDWLKLVGDANNQAELRKLYMNGIAKEGSQEELSTFQVEALYLKAMELWTKTLAECELLKREIQKATPIPMDEETRKELHRELMGQSYQQIRQTIAQMQMVPQNLHRYREAMLCLIERAEASSLLSQTSTSERLDELERRCIILEAERNAMVESLRVVASRGEYDPTKQGEQSGV